MTTSGLYGILAIVAFVLIWVFATVAFVFTKRLRDRPPTVLSHGIGSVPDVLRKVRKREPLTDDELDLARQVLSDRGNVMAYAIPATLFCLGCFYVFGSLEQLHGHTPSERTFLGVIPMLTSTSLGIRMLKSASLKRRLPRPAHKQSDAEQAAAH